MGWQEEECHNNWLKRGLLAKGQLDLQSHWQGTPTPWNLLNKGLSFVPTRTADHFVTKIELFKIFWSLRLRCFYKNVRTDQDNVTTHSDHWRFKPKSTFCPHVTNPSMNTFCRLVERDVEKLFCDSPAKQKFNLSISEKDALDKLCRDKDIVV